MTRVAVAAVSARAMAESARRGGLEVIALDCFGDEDTLGASRRWIPVGSGASPEIDAAKLLAALEEIARGGDVRAWIPGAGLEADASALERGASTLTMAGPAPADVRQVRDPKAFFDALDESGIAHPAVRFTPPDDPQGWLVKAAGGRGGWHVRPAVTWRGGAPGPGVYFQRVARGVPMSATFLADGREARLLGINRQLTASFGTRPYVFRGVVGPVPLAATALRAVDAALRQLAAAFRLRGLGSLDFMLDGERIEALEVNPRPPASFVLHEGGQSLIAAHLAACLEGCLPEDATPAPGARGTEIVYARCPLRIDAARAQRLRDWPGCHDRPRAGSTFGVGDPVCSLGAAGTDADEVEARLGEARRAMLATLETMR